MLAVTCPGCEKQLRLKDELGGKRVKCPGCGETVLVPARARNGSVAPKSQALEARRRMDEPADDEDEDERAPRTKPKKKSGSALPWILGILGAILLVCGGTAAGVVYVMYRLGKAGVESVQEMSDKAQKNWEKQREEAARAARERTETSLVGKWQYQDGAKRTMVFEFEKGGTYYNYPLPNSNPHTRPLNYLIADDGNVTLTNASGQTNTYGVFASGNDLTLTSTTIAQKPWEQTISLTRIENPLLGTWTGNGKKWIFGADASLRIEGPTNFSGSYTITSANKEAFTIQTIENGQDQSYVGLWTFKTVDNSLRLTKSQAGAVEEVYVRAGTDDGGKPVTNPDTGPRAAKEQLTGTWAGNANGKRWTFTIDNKVIVNGPTNFSGTYSITDGVGDTINIQPTGGTQDATHSGFWKFKATKNTLRLTKVQNGAVEESYVREGTTGDGGKPVTKPDPKPKDILKEKVLGKWSGEGRTWDFREAVPMGTVIITVDKANYLGNFHVHLDDQIFVDINEVKVRALRGFYKVKFNDTFTEMQLWRPDQKPETATTFVRLPDSPPGGEPDPQAEQKAEEAANKKLMEVQALIAKAQTARLAKKEAEAATHIKEARRLCDEIIKDYPKTTSGQAAAVLLPNIK